MFNFGASKTRVGIFWFGLLLFLLPTFSFAGDAANGETVFVKCKVCHEVTPDVSKIGPSLYGVMGRTAGTLESYAGFSEAMKSSGLVWDEATLKEYLKSPLTYLKGTKMAFIGLKNEQELDDVIAYMAQFSDEGASE